MYEEGFRDIHNIDISSAVTKAMQVGPPAALQRTHARMRARARTYLLWNSDNAPSSAVPDKNAR